MNPLLIGGLLLAAGVYFRGWRRLTREMPSSFGPWRLSSFLLSEAALIVAFSSPLDALAPVRLSAHMVQHLLLLVVVPPLLWLGQPFLPMLRGLPAGFRRDGLGPFLSAPELQLAGRAITHPLVCWFAGTVAMVFWHLPRFFELGLSSPGWHRAEHLSFLLGALLFWWPVIEVWPAKRRIAWLVIPYLVMGDVVNSAVSAYLVFSSHVVYPTYASLADQALAGALMWVPGSVVYLLAAGFLTIRLVGQVSNLRRVSNPPADVATPRKRWIGNPPQVGNLPHIRRVVQLGMLVLAVLVVWDGFRGPQVASMNLAGTLPWVHWRAFSMIALLFAGNLFCFGCPFTLPRDLVRRFVTPRFQWPVRLRSKWIAIALIAVFFWAYEAFRLWDSPWWTAWIIVAYFLTATVIDSLFEGASFCKYVCPIGQFHFVNSLVSPLQVTTRNPKLCESCKTHDCLHNCGLNLFQPAKQSNFDCTFCMACVSACPSANVQIRAKPLPQMVKPRVDVSALTLLIVTGAFLAAAAMTAPIESWIGGSSVRLGLFFGAGLIAIPVAARARTESIVALIPLGASMWMAHFGYHLAGSFMSPLPDWWPPLPILFLDAGLLLTLYAQWRARRGMILWAGFTVALYAAGLWILSQPMQMRGMVM